MIKILNLQDVSNKKNKSSSNSFFNTDRPIYKKIQESLDIITFTFI